MPSAANAVILLLTPSHGGDLPCEYVSSLFATLEAFRGRIRADVVRGSFLPRNRDLMISRAAKGEQGVTHLLGVDSDIAWTPADVQRLLDADVPFISGLYPYKDDSGKPVVVRPVAGEKPSSERLYFAEAVPGGFFLLRREAAQCLQDRYLPNQYDCPWGETTTALHHSFVRDRQLWGDDFAFSARWREIGGDIVVHPGVRVKHVGRKVYELKEGTP